MTGLFARCVLQKEYTLKPPGKCHELRLTELLHVPGKEPRESLAITVSCLCGDICLPLR